MKVYLKKNNREWLRKFALIKGKSVDEVLNTAIEHERTRLRLSHGISKGSSTLHNNIYKH
jgi:predicted small metal-binding protein